MDSDGHETAHAWVKSHLAQALGIHSFVHDDLGRFSSNLALKCSLEIRMEPTTGGGATEHVFDRLGG